MGFAKYHEDNLKIYDERMYYKRSNYSPCIREEYVRPKKINYNIYCPFCQSGYMRNNDLINHILASHGGVHEFVFLNNRRINDGEQIVNQIYSLRLYSFRESPKEIELEDNRGVTYSFRTQPDKYEYDLKEILQSNLYSEIQIKNIDAPVCIKQRIDINIVSIDNVYSGKYSSYLFDEQISEGLLSAKECLIYIKMLIHENTDTSEFIEYIKQSDLDESRDKEELYYYHSLYKGSIEDVENVFSSKSFRALQLLLNGNYVEAKSYLSSVKTRDNDLTGCRLILYQLENDKMGLANEYFQEGIIGVLERIVSYYSNYEKEAPNLLIREFEEISLFSQYPLINALLELNASINRRGSFSKESYVLLRELTPLAAIHYCYGLDDNDAKEKIIKSMIKIHKDSTLIKEYAYTNNYSWLKRRIYVSDGNLYQKAVLKVNKEKGNVFTEEFIKDFPYDDNIQIIPLGGESKIGASCFVISYKGYNIMLDCGLDVRKKDDEAYPLLDSINKEIDVILISHAHVDHSGGVPKAHAMWPEASILSTAPTKELLKYIYSDMARVNNGIVGECEGFEIDNVTIEKDLMLSTLKTITTVNYEEWISICDKIKIRLHPAGHVIGAAIIELIIDGKKIIYTGDYCNYAQALTGKYEINTLPRDVDYLITESTYFKKKHVDWEMNQNEIKNLIIEGISNKEAILLPASTIGRSQELVCIVGEMKLSGEIPQEIPLVIAGMAIPSITQLIPFMNDYYEQIVGLFEEFDGVSFPDRNAVVIASSGSMSKGSASYRIAQFWQNQYVKYRIISNGLLDEDTEYDRHNLDIRNSIKRASLPSHADREGILELIEFVSPKVISFVHRGFESDDELKELVDLCKRKFENDVVFRDLQSNKSEKIFDLYDWFLEGDN